MSHELTIESTEVDGRFFSAFVEYDVEWSNDGIGAYEYWGAKCYDKGHDYAEVSDFDVDCITEHFADGTEAELSKDDPIYKKVLAHIGDLVDKDADSIERDDYEPEQDDDPRDYD